MIREYRDLLEDRNGDYPAHVRIIDFQFEGTKLAASLWLGNENAGQEASALLTDADVEWLIGTLQRALDESRSKSPDLTDRSKP
jgi:hypothetical protein